MVPASGAIKGGGGDFQTLHGKRNVSDIEESPEFLVEHKYTDKESFRVSNELMADIERKAHAEGLRPMIIVNVGGERYAIVRLEDTRFL